MAKLDLAGYECGHGRRGAVDELQVDFEAVLGEVATLLGDPNWDGVAGQAAEDDVHLLEAGGGRCSGRSAGHGLCGRAGYVGPCATGDGLGSGGGRTLAGRRWGRSA